MSKHTNIKPNKYVDEITHKINKALLEPTPERIVDIGAQKAVYATLRFWGIYDEYIGRLPNVGRRAKV